MIESLTYKQNIIGEMHIADTFIKRFLGYMFQKKPRYNAILIKPCNSIHTFFMKFNIDVLFLDDEMKVIKKVSNLKPGKIIMPVKEAKMVVEAEAGMFDGVQIGNIIKCW